MSTSKTVNYNLHSWASSDKVKRVEFNENFEKVDTELKKLQHLKASTEPTTGTYILGDIVYNSNPVAGGYIGWVCVTAGTPGTWKSFGQISV